MKIIIAGDFVPRYRTAVQIEEGDYSCLEQMKPVILDADYSIVNFESPVVTREARPIVKTGPNLKCSEKAMECVANAGFKCLTLANNHFFDFGQTGVEDTLIACNKFKMDHVGGGVNHAEAQRILYKDIDGQRLAIINICENEWSIVSKEHGGSAPMNPIWNYYTIQEARQNADFVLVVVHGGIEHYPFPTPRMQDTYRFFIDAGADTVVNHHQHCYSGYEEYKGKIIFYGLGNFCFDRNGKRGDSWNEGYLVKMDFGDKGMSFEIIPYIQCDERAAVILMDDEKKRVFDDNINRLNSAISNREKLIVQLDAYVGTICERRLNLFEPFKNRIVCKLQKWGILPSFTDKGTLMILNNLIRCESHRELLLGAFKKSDRFMHKTKRFLHSL